MTNHLRKWGAAHALWICLAVVAFALSIAPASRWVTVKVHGTNGAVHVLSVPKAAVEKAQASLADHAGARDETPAGATRKVIEAAREQQDKLAANDQLPIVTPDAAPEQAGCISRFVRNYSSRRGVRPRILVLHYTVSPNRPGWADVTPVIAEFDNPAFQASSSYVIDGEGHCAYIVRESDKAWTQAALNPVAISVEVINTGREPSYLAPAGLAKLDEVFYDAAKRWEIPLQLGAVKGGVVTRPGIVDHGMLGPAGGGHHDISPYPVAAVIRSIKAYAAAHKPKPAPKPKPHVKPHVRTCTTWRIVRRYGMTYVEPRVRRCPAL